MFLGPFKEILGTILIHFLNFHIFSFLHSKLPILSQWEIGMFRDSTKQIGLYCMRGTPKTSSMDPPTKNMKKFRFRANFRKNVKFSNFWKNPNFHRARSCTIVCRISWKTEQILEIGINAPLPDAIFPRYFLSSYLWS